MLALVSVTLDPGSMLVLALFGLVAGFLASKVMTGHGRGLLAAVILVLGAPPLILYALRRRSWFTREAGDDTHAGSSAPNAGAKRGAAAAPAAA